MQIVRGGKVLRFHDLLIIHGKTFMIVLQFVKNPAFNKLLMVLMCINVQYKTCVIMLAAGVLMEEFKKASCIIKIIGHPSLVSNLYVKMSQVI